MDFNEELKRVVDSAVNTTVDIKDVSSVRELYVRKRNELGLTDYQIQNLIDIDKKTLTPILNGTAKQINVINIIKLSHFLGVSINDLMKIYIPELAPKQIGDIQKAREAGYIVSNFDLPAMKKMGFIKSTDLNSSDSLKLIKSRITTFFGLDSIYDYTEKCVFQAFSRPRRNSNDKIRTLWINSAYRQFELINNPNPYNRANLLDLIPKIRPYTRNERDGLRIVAKALFQAGVTVIFQESLPKLQIKGATFSYNNKPCVVLSDLNKRYPTLWHVLLHELYHVLYDFDEILKRTFHLTGEDDLFLIDEGSADAFATDYMLSPDRLKYISPYINSTIAVDKCAKEWGVHPSIIYAIYLYKLSESGDNNAWKYPIARLIPPMSVALDLFNTHPFEKDSLIESAKQLKTMIFNIS